MATVSQFIPHQKVLVMVGGSATATTGDAALLGIQNPEIPVLHFEVDDGETITSINLFLSSAVSGVLTNYKKTFTTS